MECEYCNSNIVEIYGSGRFCCEKCARAFSTHTKRSEINKKVSDKLKKELVEITCVVCDKMFLPSHTREKCCSKDCKTTNKYKHWLKKSKTERSKISAKGSKGKYKRNPKSIMDLSSRTVSKILQRLNIGCSRCGWNEAPCDIHHVHGRKIDNADNHSNLTYLCPNCHRLFHNGKIGPSDIITLELQVGDRWKEFYYG